MHPCAAVLLGHTYAFVPWPIALLIPRDVEEDVIPVCRELGIGIVTFSPLGRGMLTGGGLLGMYRK